MPHNHSASEIASQALDIRAYYIKSLLIIYGATATVIAGFLSQVWSSAPVAFKSSLSSSLSTIGVCFITMILVSAMSLVFDNGEVKSEKPNRFESIFFILIVTGTIGTYIITLMQVSEAIERYARI